jgi:mRNA interferase MazF
MTYRTYIPRRGDLVHMNFSPSAGHEMADRHYALVISADGYNRKARMAIACAITSRVRGWAFEVEVPAGVLPEKKGQPVTSVIIADSLRQVDYREREMEFVARAPPELLDEVLDKLFVLMEGAE